MVIYKLMFYICAFIKSYILKIIYRSKIVIGKNVTWRHRFKVMIDRNGKLEIGDGCFFNNDCSINVMKSVIIKSGTIFGEGVKIYDHNHHFSNREKSIKEQGYSIGKVEIGKHCWIGSNVVILKGTVISDNCVIGANVVVNGFIPEGVVVKSNCTYLHEKIY